MSPTRALGRLVLAAVLCPWCAALAQKPPGGPGAAGEDPLAPKTAPAPIAATPGSPAAAAPEPAPAPPRPAAPPTPGGAVSDDEVPEKATPAVGTIAAPADGQVGRIGPAEGPKAPPPDATPLQREQWLTTRIDEILARPALATAHVGVMVAEIDSGRTLYAKNALALYNPASNAKLVTTIAALGLLGPEFRFKTALYGSVKAGEVQGDLYLRGNGDPALVSEDLWKLVSLLAGGGVRRVAGRIVIDDTYFDEVRIGPAFDQKDEDYAFRAPAGAVSLNYNACTVHVLPGPKEAAPARIVVEPVSPYFTVLNQTKTVGKGKTEVTISAREVEGHTEIVVAGKIRLGAGEIVEHRRIAHPDLYTGYALRELMIRRGIKVAGEVTRGTMPPTGLRQLASHTSPPLGVIVRDVNKSSNNFMAEQLLKTLGAEVVGRPGTWPKGVSAVGRYLETIGIVPARYKMQNGSGLYDADRFTPGQFVELLRWAYRDFRFAADFVGSLAVAGADGTIGHRMEGSLAERYVRAKTGTLNGISCLSGYAGAPGRMPLAFSILMNDIPDTATTDARRAQDAIAEALVTFLGAH